MDSGLDEHAIEGLAAKLSGLELTDAEGSALLAVLARAGASGSGDEVSGFGWEEGVAAVTAPGRSGLYGPMMDYLKIDQKALRFSLGFKA